MQFHYMIFKILKLKILVDPSLVIIWSSYLYTYFFCCMLLTREEDFKRNNAFHYMTYMATPLHKNPCPGVMKFTVLVDPSLVIITIY